MEVPSDVKRPPEKTIKLKQCPKCKGTDMIVLPGSPTYYSCKNKECPSHKRPPDSELYDDLNTKA